MLAAAADLAFARGMPGTSARVEIDLWREFLQPAGAYAEAEARMQAAAERLEASVTARPVLWTDLAKIVRARGRPLDALRYLERAEAGLLDRAAGYGYHGITRAEIAGERCQAFLDLGLPDVAGPWSAQELALAEELGDPPTRLAAAIHSVNLSIATEGAAQAVRRLDAIEADPLLQPLLETFGCLLVARRGIALAELEKADPSREPLAEPVLLRALAQPDLPPLERGRVRLALAAVRLHAGDAAGAVAVLDAGGDGELCAPHDLAHAAALRTAAAIARDAGPAEFAPLAERLLADYRAFLADAERHLARSEGAAFFHFGERRLLASAVFRAAMRALPGDAGVLAALDLLMEAEGLGALSRARGAPRATVALARERLLGEGEGWLFYLPAVDRTHVFALDRERVVHCETERRDPLFAACQEFVSVATRPPLGLAAARAAELHAAGTAAAAALLPEPIAERVQHWTDVVVVGADFVRAVPFEALPLRSGEFLGLARAVSYLPSVPFALAAAAEPLPGGRRFDCTLAAAPPAPREGEFAGLPLLEFTADDVARIHDVYGAARFHEVVGPAFDRAALLDLAKASGRVLQVWTHGLSSLERERPAGLLVGGREPAFWCDDAERVAWPPLVVLAACGAARGPLRIGEDGVSHLGGALLRGGARAVVLPAADVEVEATKRLMFLFHHHLRRLGQSPARALHAARVALAAEPEFRDPFYWALIQVHGLGQEPLFPELARGADGPPPGAALAGLAAAVLALVAGGALFSRRR